jgi:hypothetical protein
VPLEVAAVSPLSSLPASSEAVFFEMGVVSGIPALELCAFAAARAAQLAAASEALLFAPEVPVWEEAPVWPPAGSAAVVVLSVGCAAASAPPDAAAVGSGVAVRAVRPFTFAAPVVAVFTAVPLALALMIAVSMVLTRCRMMLDPALAFVPAFAV